MIAKSIIATSKVAPVGGAFIDDFVTGVDQNLGDRTGWTWTGAVASTLRVLAADDAVGRHTVQPDYYLIDDLGSGSNYIELDYIGGFGVWALLGWTDPDNCVEIQILGTGPVGLNVKSILANVETSHYVASPGTASRWRFSIGDGAATNLRIYADDVEVGGSPFTSTAPTTGTRQGLRGGGSGTNPVIDRFEGGVI